MSLKPSPVTTAQECSVCGLAWDRHGKNPTAKTCIDLLRADVTATRLQLANRPYVQPLPYRPYVTPFVVGPYGPYWAGGGGATWNITSGTGANLTGSQLAQGTGTSVINTTSRTI